MMNIVNRTQKIIKKPLKNYILDGFNKKNGKFFYSFEVTPRSGLEVDFQKLSKLPLFVDVTWIGNQNLKCNELKKSPAFELSKSITCVNTVNSLTCFQLEDRHIDEILDEGVENLTLLRGDKVDDHQKYKFANELIKAVRERNSNVTIMTAGYPDKHPEASSMDEDLQHLKSKVDSGADVIISQLTFSSSKFINFVKNCREIGIPEDIPILPGLYIPHSLNELKLILKITNVEIPKDFYAQLENLSGNEEKFQEQSLNFTLKCIKDIQQKCTEHIRGFHFYTMNNLHMLRKLIEIVNFS